MNKRQLSKNLLHKILQYKEAMRSHGYSTIEILQSLSHMLPLDTRPPQLPLSNLLQSLATILDSQPTPILTDMLISLEISIAHLQQQEGDLEQLPLSQLKPIDQRKQKCKKKGNEKKGNDKKKAKKGKQSALEEIRQKVIADGMCQRKELVQNMQKIEMLKTMLERKIWMDLCQQSLSNLSSIEHILA